jgi:hypothetical protein
MGGATAFSLLLTPFILPLLLGAVGFGAGGVVAGSWAAAIHALIGNVAGGSLFALCQAIGAGAVVPFLGYVAGAVGATALMEALRMVMRSTLAAHIAGMARGWATHIAGIAGGWARHYMSIMARSIRMVVQNRMVLGGFLLN